ncbi:hypothetical protein nbrc107696_05050 [Gordonia spumicola]|uniref:Secreted protein n=1 Tax=Gordonia spumicola TaxID=589161 RepID=A0A7I9V3Q7_9ACTN|nr:hypothetical protein [Gordonia spumicola]GEE00059.1 hypothetical protein nbrc107696_05050 [Gordonia spumicola]
MKLSLKLAAVSAAAAATAVFGVVPGEAAAANPTQPTQPAGGNGGVVVTNTNTSIDVLVVNRQKASECTVTASRPDGAATKVFTKKITLNDANQHTAAANISGLGPYTYTVTGKCVEPNADPTKPASESNLFGGTNLIDIKLKGGTSTPTNQCLLIVKGVAWDLGLRGAPLEFVMGIATQFCPK